MEEYPCDGKFVMDEVIEVYNCRVVSCAVRNAKMRRICSTSITV